jgi:hypothetical protein
MSTKTGLAAISIAAFVATAVCETVTTHRRAHALRPALMKGPVPEPMPTRDVRNRRRTSQSLRLPGRE